MHNKDLKHKISFKKFFNRIFDSIKSFFLTIIRSKKTPIIAWSSIYILMVVALCISAVTIYHNMTIKSIFVSGLSMSPTLKGGDDAIGSHGIAEFGLIDTTHDAKNHIKRFNIVTTYYPWDSGDYAQPYVDGSAPLEGADFKIKRVIGLPGDLINIHNGILEITTGAGQKIRYDDNEEGHHFPFKRKANGDGTYSRTVDNVTVPLGQYFIMGDNWSYGGSSDSANHTPIYYNNICGVLTMIQGTCEIKYSGHVKQCVNHTYYSTPYIPF